jgi:hypothetical protein
MQTSVEAHARHAGGSATTRAHLRASPRPLGRRDRVATGLAIEASDTGRSIWFPFRAPMETRSGDATVEVERCPRARVSAWSRSLLRVVLFTASRGPAYCDRRSSSAALVLPYLDRARNRSRDGECDGRGNCATLRLALSGSLAARSCVSIPYVSITAVFRGLEKIRIPRRARTRSATDHVDFIFFIVL